MYSAHSILVRITITISGATVPQTRTRDDKLKERSGREEKKNREHTLHTAPSALCSVYSHWMILLFASRETLDRK